MIVHYLAPSGVLLLSRAQETPPANGDRVAWDEGGAVPRFYRVVCREWPLRAPPPGQQFYSPRDSAEVLVRVLLQEEEA